MDKRTLIIAEAGVNHNGSRERALELVQAAARAGADVVKFQSFKADKVVTAAAPKAAYQDNAVGEKQSQFDMLRKLELSDEDHRAIAEACGRANVAFMSTPFDTESATYLDREIGVDTIKISSGDLTNSPFLLHVARLGKPIILSTGMATIDEIETALAIIVFGYERPAGERPASPPRYESSLQRVLLGRVTLLHCTTEYPAPPQAVNLRAMVSLHETFGLDVGLSDHTRGIHFPVAAVALGARTIEKHFTLDRTLPGPDHRASIEPDELAALVRNIREIEVGLGHGRKEPAPEELRNRDIVRRSLVATKPIRAGEAFTEMNLSSKRPGHGVPPALFWSYVGQVATRDYLPDELIDKI